MSNYIASNENRFYAELESTYGAVPSVTAANRFPAVKLAARQLVQHAARRDKTGGRSFLGIPAGARKQTTFDLQTYLTGWADQTVPPGYGPLFEASMGKPGIMHAGGTIDSSSSPTRLRFTLAHVLSVGQAVVFGGEMRFVSNIVNNQEIEINAPFTIQPSSGSPMGPSMTYMLGAQPGSLSIFDFWSPSVAVQRIISGAAVNRLSVQVNADYHEFNFSGPARDVLDTSSFTGGQGGLTQFPLEPAQTQFDYSVIPGHLGQVWMGNTPNRFYTLTAAALTLDNSLDVRNHEFGSDGPQGVMGGRRNVSLDLSLYQQDDVSTKGLYQAARQRSPIGTMFQLGQEPGQLFGFYLKSMVPEVPEFEDTESRLQWKFSNCRALGTADDEAVIAFG